MIFYNCTFIFFNIFNFVCFVNSQYTDSCLSLNIEACLDFSPSTLNERC